jgi:hypothetical protein
MATEKMKEFAKRTGGRVESAGAAHTPEPWQVSALSIGHNGNGPYTYPLGRDSETAVANAARIVACVNALAGMNPDAVADVVAALEETLRALEAHLDESVRDHSLKHRDTLCPCNRNEVARARAALERLGS